MRKADDIGGKQPPKLVPRPIIKISMGRAWRHISNVKIINEQMLDSSLLTCSMSKSHSGEGERRSACPPGGGVHTAGEPACGSSGITANLPRCKIGEMAP